MSLRLRQNSHQSSLCTALSEISTELEGIYSGLQSLLASGAHSPEAFMTYIEKAIPLCTTFSQAPWGEQF